MGTVSYPSPNRSRTCYSKTRSGGIRRGCLHSALKNHLPSWVSTMYKIRASLLLDAQPCLFRYYVQIALSPQRVSKYLEHHVKVICLPIKLR